MRLLHDLYSLLVNRTRGSGATSRMLDQVRSNDIIISGHGAQAGLLEQQLRDYIGLKDVRVISVDQLDRVRGRGFNNYHFDHYALEVIFGRFAAEFKVRDAQVADLEGRLTNSEQRVKGLIAQLERIKAAKRLLCSL